jgi:hypothetical protein
VKPCPGLYVLINIKRRQKVLLHVKRLSSPEVVRVYGTMLGHCRNLQVVVYTTVDMPLILYTSYYTPCP